MYSKLGISLDVFLQSFIGLAGSEGGYVAVGSECGSVFLHHISTDVPVACKDLSYMYQQYAKRESCKNFISSACFLSEDVVATGSSWGTINIFSLRD